MYPIKAKIRCTRSLKFVVVASILFSSLYLNAQESIPILKSNSYEIDFIDGGVFYKGGWTANPKINTP